MTLRAKRLFCFVLFVASVSCLAVLARHRHYSRLVLGSLEEVPPSAVGQSPENTPLFKKITAKNDHIPNYREALEVLRKMDLAARSGKPAYEVPDAPDSCVAAVGRGTLSGCYNTNIAAIAYLQRAGFYARLWELTGSDGFGGFGHNIIELWDQSRQEWMSIDPYWTTYPVRREDTTQTMSVMEVRERYLMDTASIRILSYTTPGTAPPESQVISEKQMLMHSVALYANADLDERFDKRYGPLQFLAPALDKLPLPVTRGLRMALTGSLDKKYLITDKHSPDYHVAKWKAIFYLLLVTALWSAIGLLLLLFRKSQPGSAFRRSGALWRNVRRVSLTVPASGSGDLGVDLAAKHNSKSKQE